MSTKQELLLLVNLLLKKVSELTDDKPLKEKEIKEKKTMTEEEREKHRKYHREYYHKNLETKNKAKEKYKLKKQKEQELFNSLFIKTDPNTNNN